jgi:Calpain family cysteine protease
VSTNAVAIPDAVRNLAGKVVKGNPANNWFQGQWLGDLWPGAPASQLDTLVQKWFYGADHPQTDTDPTTGNPYAYAQAGGTLFGASGVPNYNNVAQGGAADCYFMSSLGQVALQAPAAIQNMFTDNGDGTYTVRFYNNGVADYVTVDGELPVTNDGSFSYAGYYQYGQPTAVTSSGNVLWVALAEKAYAQLAEEGWSRADHGSFANSYDSISYGWMVTVMSQVTGSTVDSSVILAGPGSMPNAESVVLNDLAQDHLIGMMTLAIFPDDNTALIGDHAYVLESYDPSTGLFTFVNPYDDGNSARVVQATWDQLAPYVFDFEDLTAPAGMSVTSVVGNPAP